MPFLLFFALFALVYAWWAYRYNLKRLHKALESGLVAFSDEETIILFRQNLLASMPFGSFAIVFTVIALTNNDIVLRVSFGVCLVFAVVCYGYILVSTLVTGVTYWSMHYYNQTPRRLDRTGKVIFAVSIAIPIVMFSLLFIATVTARPTG